MRCISVISSHEGDPVCQVPKHPNSLTLKEIHVAHEFLSASYT
ncbi:hypothetical protein HDF12_002243 [Edaphobacter lichenicola]|uniref:Uncharacterized protein n=1 Tax=Tunturiibacter lichenicola TaxID=2051959 RepID=A0A7Y9NN78_9BACT|nr:hypothetical protein [Edaphobacter lichenicola]